MRVLDLCAGTKSMRQALQDAGWGGDRLVYVSVDCLAKHQPDVLCDLVAAVADGSFFKSLESRWGTEPWDVVWASPPCTEFSCAKTVGTRDLATANAVVAACLAVIRRLRPRVWFMENPATGLLHKQEAMRTLEHLRHTVCYCRYGTPYRKPTSIWTNVPFRPRPMCTPKQPCSALLENGGRVHPATAQNGPNSKRKLQQTPTKREISYKVPTPLIQELLQAGLGQGLGTHIVHTH